MIISRERRVSVGRVGRPHGVRGEVLVQVWSDLAERFEPGSRLVWIAERGELERELEVATSRPTKGGLIIGFAGFADRDLAGALRNGELEAQAHPEAAPEGQWFYYQLVGCRCRDGAGVEVGEVVDLIEDGGGLLLVVRTAEGNEFPIPFAEALVHRVDVEAGWLDVELPPGLVETCGSAS